MKRNYLSYTMALILQAIENGYGYGFDIMAVTGLASGTVYDVAVGDLAQLAVSGTAGSTGLACGLAVPDASDGSILAAGTGVYYLVRGRNVCGAGEWGDSGACP